jgi:hypothetical protein
MGEVLGGDGAQRSSLAVSEIEELAEERNGKTKHKHKCCGRETEQEMEHSLARVLHVG